MHVAYQITIKYVSLLLTIWIACLLNRIILIYVFYILNTLINMHCSNNVHVIQQMNRLSFVLLSWLRSIYNVRICCTLFGLLNSLYVHYNDVIMIVMASQITSLKIVYSTVYSSTDQKKNINAPRHCPLWGFSPVSGEFPTQRVSNSKNISIWWRHHVCARMWKCMYAYVLGRYI